jgi:hypothetical protein
VATTPELQGALNWAGYCFAQNGVIIYPNAFGTFGNVGRNILRGPHFVNWDFSTSKVWKLNERLILQLRGEFFNILNHANFASPSGNLVSRHMGQLRTTPDVAASNPVVGSGATLYIQPAFSAGSNCLWSRSDETLSHETKSTPVLCLRGTSITSSSCSGGNQVSES